MTVSLYQGDCLDVLKQIADNSVDSLVTDPPAAIDFMEKEWDGDKGGREQWIAWLASIMKETLRALKPGAHALVWAFPRMSHWTMLAIEDGGFEIRDVVTHLFSQGMAKSKDISKAIDKAGGIEGTYGDVKSKDHAAWIKRGQVISEGSNEGWDRPWMDDPEAIDKNARKYIPGSEMARRWLGWGTALKPGAEYWILARKPLGEKTLTGNIIVYGSGAINIEESRTEHGWPYNVITDEEFGLKFYYCPKAPKKDKGADNSHPTVKNTVLMEYLIRLITPVGGVVLDPFMGSGSTGVAAVRGGWSFVGIELSDEYFQIAQRRIEGT